DRTTHRSHWHGNARGSSLNYCKTCRRHLNGAVSCPGCGATGIEIERVQDVRSTVQMPRIRDDGEPETLLSTDGAAGAAGAAGADRAADADGADEVDDAAGADEVETADAPIDESPSGDEWPAADVDADAVDAGDGGGTRIAGPAGLTPAAQATPPTIQAPTEFPDFPDFPEFPKLPTALEPTPA